MLVQPPEVLHRMDASFYACFEPSTQLVNSTGFLGLAPGHELLGADTSEFRDISATQRDFVMDFIRSSNRCRVFDSRTEGSNESYNRVWRRWLGFCEQAGQSHDPFLDNLSTVG